MHSEQNNSFHTLHLQLQVPSSAVVTTEALFYVRSSSERGSRRCSAIVRGCQAVTPIIGHMVTTQCGDASHEGDVT